MNDTELDDLLGYHLVRAAAVMRADLALCLAELGLQVTEMSVLMTINGHRDRTQSDIGRIIGIQRANMAPLTATLEARGLIARNPVDGRSHALALTAAGQALLDRARQRVVEHEAAFLTELSTAERAKLIALLASIWQKPGTD